MGSDVNAPYLGGETDPAKIIVELCALLYREGGMVCTAGGMSIRDGSHIYLTPSGVQKERMRPQDIFVYSRDAAACVYSPLHLKPSACMPLFAAFHSRYEAGACIHTHSQDAVVATLLWDKEVRIANFENLKAIPRVTASGNLSFNDELVIPIIENAPHEDELLPDIQRIIAEYPSATAVLVRRHGLFVWGVNIWKAKITWEAIEYLLSLAIRLHSLGIDAAGPKAEKKCAN